MKRLSSEADLQTLRSVILLPVEGFQVFADAVDLVGIPTLLAKYVGGSEVSRIDC